MQHESTAVDFEEVITQDIQLIPNDFEEGAVPNFLVNQDNLELLRSQLAREPQSDQAQVPSSIDPKPYCHSTFLRYNHEVWLTSLSPDSERSSMPRTLNSALSDMMVALYATLAFVGLFLTLL